jgi:pyruvate formate lyase activating enzyme
MTKGLVFDIRRYSVHDGPGIRTTVFLKGCPLRCPWCHNPEGLTGETQVINRNRKLNGKHTLHQESVGEWMSPGKVLEIILKDRIFYEESGGGVTFSGGEPLMQPEFMIEMLSLCREAGIHNAVDTSGHAQGDQFTSIAAYTDLFLFDLKCADTNRHLSFTGVGNEVIMSNLRSLSNDGPGLIIRIPVIPAFNNEPHHMEAILDRLLEIKARVIRIDLLPYHRLGSHKYHNLGMQVPRNIYSAIDQDQINNYLQIFSSAGFNVKKGG